MKKLVEDFKSFAFKGNVIDLAVGVVIGGAFGKIVSSFVADVITPLISLLTKGTSLVNLFVVLGKTEGAVFNTIEEATTAGFATLNYGMFIQNIIDFFIIAISIFIVIRIATSSRKKVEAAIHAGKQEEEVEVVEEAPTTKECPFCKTVIHIDATRCPNCTSELPVESEE